MHVRTDMSSVIIVVGLHAYSTSYLLQEIVIVTVVAPVYTRALLIAP